LICAFFDIDGTLLDGFMIQSFPRFLADNGVIDSENPDKIDDVVSAYISGEKTYREAAEAVPAYYAKALKKMKYSEVKNQSRHFINEYLPNHVFPYSKQLVYEVSKLVDVTIALSGSPLEVVEELNEFAFDKFYGSIFEVEDGCFTGNVKANLILGEVKAQFAKQISEDLQVKLEESVAFADTDQDELLLDMVGLSFALNPNEKLKKICISKNWLYFNRSLIDIDKITNIIRSEKIT
jgi:putative phosphoserine phosphatase/1-acylglycerol-3-phosphate O-acyltransferase